MTEEKFKEIRSVVEEIEKLEAFIPIFKEGWCGNNITANKRLSYVVDGNATTSFHIKEGSPLHEKILSALEERLAELKNILEKA